MKNKLKLFTVLILIAALLLCSCQKTKENPKLLLKLKEQYPNAQIVSAGDVYNVTETVSITGLEKQEASIVDYMIFDDYESFEQACIIPSKTLIFKGKRTDVVKQTIPISITHAVMEGQPKAEMQIEVIEAYYGDVNAGDFVTYTDFFYVTENKDGKRVIVSHGAKIPDEGELIYILYLYGKPDDSKKVYCNAYGLLRPLAIEIYENANQQNFILSNVYKKYILSNEAASDKTSLAIKELQWQRELASRRTGFKNKRIVSKCDKVLALENPTQTQLMEALPEAEREIINRLVEKYSKKTPNTN